MAKFASQFKRIKVATQNATPAEFEVTFFFDIVDSPNDIDLDFPALMLKLGFDSLYDTFASYYSQYPESFGIPEHIDLIPFLSILKSKGVYDVSFNGFRQHKASLAHYDEVMGISNDS